MRGKFNSYLMIFGIELMLFVSLFNTVLPPLLVYADDIFCAIIAALLIVDVIRGKRVFKFYIYIVLLIAIGLMGNLIFDIQQNFLLALTDAFMFLKPYILLMYITTTISPAQAKHIYRVTSKVSKAAIILLSAFSALSFFFKSIFSRMLNGNLEFVFYSGFTGTVSMTVILCMAVIVSDPQNNRLLYYILSSIVIICAKSGLGMLAIALYAAVYLFFEKKKRFHWYYLLIIVPICLWVGRNEISGYLLNTNAPRYLLLYYSFVTAWSCLPIGSGFASYGSSLAASQYSKLYYNYGFSKRWGMSVGNTSFLMDSYYPQIIGQTGFLGSILYSLFIYKLFFKIIWPIKNVSVKSALIFLFAVWAASGLGFGCGSQWGCLVYSIIPILYLSDKINLSA